MRASLRPQKGALLRRLKRAWRALTGPEPALAVIYDYKVKDDDDEESYYGYFANRDEALQLFNTCYPEGSGMVHNAHLVEVVEELRPHDGS